MRNGRGWALGAIGAATLLAGPAWAQGAPALVRAPSPAQALAMVGKGDTAWMLVSTALVLMMSAPALALFYGGLVRAKNMLSVCMQVFSIVCIAALVWVSWGYSLAFTGGSPFIGGLGKAFGMGVGVGTTAATYSNNVYLPEYAYLAFQMTFACITPALIVGAFAERVRFTPLMIFAVLWLTLVYCPLAHCVWYWAGPDYLPDAPGDAGFLFKAGALDFAGGTVVHIDAGIAGLVGCLVIGRRLGFRAEPMPPHSLVMTLIGASLLWVGWFGFNAGSALEANGTAALALVNTLVATAAAAVAWAGIEQALHRRSSLLGAVTGAIAGLVAVTPASGYAHPTGAILLGFAASGVCFFFVTTVKSRFGYDDTLDVFGVHCVGGVVGALATAILAAPSLGGQGYMDYTRFPAVPAAAYDIAHQLWVQAEAVLLTLGWSGGVSFLLFTLLDRTMGLRPTPEIEHDGLDLAEHGERAYSF